MFLRADFFLILTQNFWELSRSTFWVDFWTELLQCFNLIWHTKNFASNGCSESKQKVRSEASRQESKFKRLWREASLQPFLAKFLVWQSRRKHCNSKPAAFGKKIHNFGFGSRIPEIKEEQIYWKQLGRPATRREGFYQKRKGNNWNGELSLLFLICVRAAGASRSSIPHSSFSEETPLRNNRVSFSKPPAGLGNLSSKNRLRDRFSGSISRQVSGQGFSGPN